MWLLPEPPAAADVVAIYTPLRAVVDGWSGTTSDGWNKVGQAWDGSSAQDLVRFEIVREWFAASGAARGLRLHVRIGASSFAEEGRTRRGFRYRIGADPPMEVLESWWIDARGKRVPRAVPQIQIMAPPRIKRVSDYRETIVRLNTREAELWSQKGIVHGVFRMPDATQQRTPAGRGIPLFDVLGGAALMGITGRLYQLYRVQIQNPLVVRARTWEMLHTQVEADARGLGLDLGTDATIEWWLDRQGYDGTVFERGSHPFAQSRTIVAFRRAHIAAIDG
jgi:hypothetical protein